MAKAKVVELSAEVSTLLNAWLQEQANLKATKEKEFALRNEVILKAGFDPTKLEGTETLEIGNGYKLKATKDQSYTLTDNNGETVKLLESIGALRPDIAASLLKRWKPEISETIYKRELLPFLARTDVEVPALQEIRIALAAALTVKPGSPQLELIAPEPPKTETNPAPK